MATITATAQPSTSPPRVRIDATGFTGPDVALVRIDPDGARRPVRAAEGRSFLAGAWSGYDYEAPYGRPVRYAVAAETSAPITLTATQAWLIHPIRPLRSLRIGGAGVKDARIVTAGQRTRAVRQGVVEPLGRATPIVWTDGTRASVASQIVFLTRYLPQGEQLREILEDATPLLLSVPDALGWGRLWEYVAVGDVVEERVVRLVAQPSRRWTLPYRVVERPAGPPSLEALWSWDDVATEVASWDQVLTRYATWEDLAANRRRDVVVTPPEPDPLPGGPTPLPGGGTTTPTNPPTGGTGGGTTNPPTGGTGGGSTGGGTGTTPTNPPTGGGGTTVPPATGGGTGGGSTDPGTGTGGSPTPTPVQPQVGTWDDVATRYATWDAVQGAYATWADLAAGVERPLDTAPAPIGTQGALPDTLPDNLDG